MTTGRKAGWYWVKVHGSQNWECARWNGTSQWYVTGNQADIVSKMIEEIGPRIPTPDEPWQCVPVEPTEIMQDEGLIVMPTPDAHPYDCGMVYKAMITTAPKPEDK